MSTTPTLLPCPFCGGAARVRDYSDRRPRFYVECESDEDCGASQTQASSEDAAIRAWNRRAALTQGDGEAVEPVAYQIRRTDGKGVWEPCTREYYDDTMRTGRYAGWDTGPAAEVRALVPAQQLQQAVARALEPIRQAIRDYHYALDTRQHGGVAQGKAVRAIEEALGMNWKQGEEAAIRAKGTHD